MKEVEYNFIDEYINVYCRSRVVGRLRILPRLRIGTIRMDGRMYLREITIRHGVRERERERE